MAREDARKGHPYYTTVLAEWLLLGRNARWLVRL